VRIQIKTALWPLLPRYPEVSWVHDGPQALCLLDIDHRYTNLDQICPLISLAQAFWRVPLTTDGVLGKFIDLLQVGMSTPDRDRICADAKMHALVEVMGYNKSLQQEVGQVPLDLIDDTECERRPTPCQPLSTMPPYSRPEDRDLPADQKDVTSINQSAGILLEQNDRLQSRLLGLYCEACYDRKGTRLREETSSKGQASQQFRPSSIL
jgi:hypothetical protein